MPSGIIPGIARAFPNAACPVRYPHPIIAREGWPFLAIAFVVAAALTWYGLWVLGRRRVDRRSSSSLQFFRDPARTIPAQANAVLAPADGRVVKVEKARDPYLDRDALKISVFMNVFNVHCNRSPVDGVVVDALVSPGQLPQCGARQGVARERAQRAAPAHARGTERDVRADRRPRRAAHPVLRRRRAPRSRAASATASSASARASTCTSIPRRSRRWRSATRWPPPKPSWPSSPEDDAMIDSTTSAPSRRTASAGAGSTSCPTCSRWPRCSRASTRSCRR